MKKVGFFGGSFDPIHLGHINLAIEIIEKSDLNEVLFVPAKVSPFKVERPPLAKDQDRLEMIKLAIEEIPSLSVCDRELKREGPSYTIDTLLSLYEENDKQKFHLILTDDMLGSIEMWKDIEKILQLAPPYIGVRSFLQLSFDDLLPPALMQLLEQHKVFTRVMQISSSEIRERLNKKLYCSHLIPAKVLDYIYKNELYSSETSN